MTVRLFAVAAGTEDGLLAAIRGTPAVTAPAGICPRWPSTATTRQSALPVWHYRSGTTGLAHRAALTAESYDDLAAGLDKLLQGWADQASAPSPSHRPASTRTSPVRERRRRVPNEYLAE